VAFIPSKYVLSHDIKTRLAGGDTTIKNKGKGKEKDMEFLKAIYGDKALTYDEVVQAINAHNGNEANKDNQIKIGNLGKGEYVSAGKYNSLQETLNGKDAEIANANNLIAELRKASKGNEEMQQKFTEYEAENAKLQAELQETKIKSAIKVALLSEKAVDVDYLTFKLNEKLKEKGETLELDENENIKGWDDKLSGLKTQFPTMFEGKAEGSDGYVPVENKGLPQNYSDKSVTKEQFRSMTYEERVALKQQNEQLYKQLAK